MKLKRIIAVLVLVVLMAAVGAFVVNARPAKTAEDTSASAQVQVLAAENFWGNIAQQLGGSHVHVTSIITDPTTDPHQYESSARDAAAVASADVVVVNGLGYDDFIAKLLDASKNNKRQVLTVAQILNAPEGANQHLWYDIPRVPEVASRLVASLAAKDPAHKSDYMRNLAAFNKSLQPLLDSIDSIKQRYPGAPVAYTEPVPGYLLQAAGLAVKTPEGFAKSIEDGDDPGPADTTAMDELVANRQIKVLLYNAQATSPVTEHVKDLAKQAGVPVVGVTETLPPNQPTYQAWQLDQLQQLEQALAKQ